MLVGCLLLPDGGAAAPGAGQPVPAVKVATLTGEQAYLDHFKGKVLVLDFFSTWCSPCRETIPHLLELKRKYGSQGLQILGVSAGGESERQIRAFIQEYRITYPVVVESDAVLSAFGVRSVPVMVVIDRNGTISEIFRGYSKTMERSSDLLIRKLLAGA